MNKIKASFICVLLIIISFFLNSNLYADKFSIKLLAGKNSGGALTDSFIFNPEYYSNTAVFPPGKQKMGVDLYFEFSYALNPYVSFSVGTGYATKTLDGISPQFEPHEGSPFNTNYTLKPSIIAEIAPFCLSTQLSLPLSQHFRINLKAGVGYYYSNFDSLAELRLERPNQVFTYTPANYSGSGGSVGYHLGGSLDIPTPIAGIDFTVEVLHTWIKFEKITILQTGAEGTTFSSFWLYPEGRFYLDYIVSVIDLSGFTFRAGCKIRF
ncbi:MAG: hypothetical protein MUP98_16330 [Candidatus Aminicenantes bacterium]|nr:hypothetical protein [Candidatus Aminicenantes bacterium]